MACDVHINLYLLNESLNGNYNRMANRDFSRGQGGHSTPLEMILLPELCLNDKLSLSHQLLSTTETIIIFVIDLPLCQTIHKIDLTFMVTPIVHQTYTAQSFRLPPYSLI